MRNIKASKCLQIDNYRKYALFFLIQVVKLGYELIAKRCHNICVYLRHYMAGGFGWLLSKSSGHAGGGRLRIVIVLVYQVSDIQSINEGGREEGEG